MASNQTISIGFSRSVNGASMEANHKKHYKQFKLWHSKSKHFSPFSIMHSLALIHVFTLKNL